MLFVCPTTTRSTTYVGRVGKTSNTALLTDTFHSALRASRGAAKRER
jgi:hypothetical protein